MKILIPVDGSSYSKTALAFLASRRELLALKPHIELLVAPEPLPEIVPRIASKETLMKYYEISAEDVLKPSREFLAKEKIHAEEKVFLTDEPAQAILEEAKITAPDLIIMGSKNYGVHSGYFVGSVTGAVLSHTTEPVLVIRNRPVPEKADYAVGICVDGSDYSRAAVQYAADHKELFGKNAEYHLIHVSGDYSDLMALGNAMVAKLISSHRKESYERVADTVRPTLEAAGITPVEVSLTGNPGNEIAAYAKKAGLDMLVLGSRGQNTLMTAVLGSTASRTASQADVPLLVIRKPLKKEVGAS